MAAAAPIPVGGYVLAGGRSSRMGSDKALLPLAGRPLLQHAVVKLRRLCAETTVLANRPELAGWAPLLGDVHPGCGPMGGLETALLHTQFEWNLFLPVDVPFLPVALLHRWTGQVLPRQAARGARVLMFRENGRPQPTVVLLHREVRRFLTAALQRGEYKLLPALEQAAHTLAAEAGFAPEDGMCALPFEDVLAEATALQAGAPPWLCLTAVQEREAGRWFSNLNTPADFADAECHPDALDEVAALGA